MDEEMITSEELAEAIKKLTEYKDIGMVMVHEEEKATLKFSKNYVSPVTMADDLFGMALSERYKQGSIWRDANGIHYQRADGRWLMFGRSAPTPHNYPVRPLVKVAD